MWRMQEEQDGLVFYTTNPSTGAVYAIFTEWPASPYIALQTPMAQANTTISMLGVNGTKRAPALVAQIRLNPHFQAHSTTSTSKVEI